MQHEPGNMKAGILALLVHAVFFALLVFGLSWQKQEPEAVVVDLWNKLPSTPRVAPPPPAPEPVKAQPRPEPKVESKPLPKVEPAKPDIALKAKKEEKKPVETKPVAKPVEPPKKPPVAAQQQDREAAMQKMLEMMARQNNAADQARAEDARLSAAQQSIKGEYIGRIKRKIRGFLNQRVCGDGNPQLEFEIALFPTGQLRGSPVMRKSSGITPCDRAVESAILQAEPLPVPPQPEVFNEFRNLRLVFKPNDPND